MKKRNAYLKIDNNGVLIYFEGNMFFNLLSRNPKDFNFYENVSSTPVGEGIVQITGVLKRITDIAEITDDSEKITITTSNFTIIE